MYRYYGPRESKPTISEVLGPHPDRLAIDVETVSLKDRTPIGISVCADKSEALYFPMFNEYGPMDNGDIPWELISDQSILRIYHNSPFDLHVLQDWEPDPHNLVDTLVMAHLLNLPGELHELIYYLDLPHPVESARYMLEEAHASTMLDLPSDTVAIKCCQDTIGTIAAYEVMKDEVDPGYFKAEMELIPILMRMSQRGIAIDQEVREAFEDELTDELLYYRSLAEAEGFNPGSPNQVGYILAKRGNWLPFTRGGRSIKTDVKTLEKCNDPMAALTLQYRHYQKMLGTYVRPLAGAGRAYTRFHLDAITGRISSTERNLQNVPPLIRPMFVPDNGIFTDFDFSQIEMRILAHLSGDLEMQHILAKPGGSIHQDTADFMGIPYKRAKNVGFAVIFGATEETVMETAKLSDRELARRYLESWGKKYPQAWSWIEFQQEYGLRHGTCHTMGGREFKLPVEVENEGAIKRKSVNYPIQGTAAEALKKALRICRDMELAHQVHDEIILDGLVPVPKEELECVLEPMHTPISIKRMMRWE